MNNRPVSEKNQNSLPSNETNQNKYSMDPNQFDQLINFFNKNLSGGFIDALYTNWDKNKIVQDYYYSRPITLYKSDDGKFLGSKRITFNDLISVFEKLASNHYEKIALDIWNNNLFLKNFYLGKTFSYHNVPHQLITISNKNALHMFKLAASRQMCFIPHDQWIGNHSLRKDCQNLNVIEFADLFQCVLISQNSDMIINLWALYEDTNTKTEWHQFINGQPNQHMAENLLKKVLNSDHHSISAFIFKYLSLIENNNLIKNVLMEMHKKPQLSLVEKNQIKLLNEQYFKIKNSQNSKVVNPSVQQYPFVETPKPLQNATMNPQITGNSTAVISSIPVNLSIQPLNSAVASSAVLSRVQNVSVPSMVITPSQTSMASISNILNAKQSESVFSRTVAPNAYTDKKNTEQKNEIRSIIAYSPITLLAKVESFKKAFSHRNNSLNQFWNEEKISDYFYCKPVSENNQIYHIPFNDLIENFEMLINRRYNKIAKDILENNLYLKKYFSGEKINYLNKEYILTLNEALKFFESILSSESPNIIKTIALHPLLKKYCVGEEVIDENNVAQNISVGKFTDIFIRSLSNHHLGVEFAVNIFQSYMRSANATSFLGLIQGTDNKIPLAKSLLEKVMKSYPAPKSKFYTEFINSYLSYISNVNILKYVVDSIKNMKPNSIRLPEYRIELLNKRINQLELVTQTNHSAENTVSLTETFSSSSRKRLSTASSFSISKKSKYEKTTEYNDDSEYIPSDYSDEDINIIPKVIDDLHTMLANESHVITHQWIVNAEIAHYLRKLPKEIKEKLSIQYIRKWDNQNNCHTVKLYDPRILSELIKERDNLKDKLNQNNYILHAQPSTVGLFSHPSQEQGSQRQIQSFSSTINYPAPK